MRRLAIVLALAIPAQLHAENVSQAQAAQPAQRAIKLEGGSNFGDLGGYRTAKGRSVRWGYVYRSASLAGLTPQDQKLVDGLNIRSMIDFRSTDERKRDSSTWLTEAGHGYWARDYAMSYSDLMKAFGDMSKLTPESAKAAMASSYRALPREQAASFRVLFGRLVAGQGPVVFNCTAGKDRTGVAAALVLTALGVPYQTVKEDYLLSNVMLDKSWLSRGTGMPGMSPDVARALMGVDGSYLDAAFDQMNKDYGSVDGYLKKELGVGPKEISILRKRLLV
jgi:protein-tyrosine phosphatase